MTMTIKELNEMTDFEPTIIMDKGRAVVKMNKKRNVEDCYNGVFMVW